VLGGGQERISEKFGLCLLFPIFAPQKKKANMINLTKHSLQKLEVLFQELGYIIRYEKGNFNSGYCMVEARNIVIINKFFETEARINVLLDILQNLNFEAGVLSEKSGKFYERVLKHSTEGDEEQSEEQP
jgi:hypothetical protein